MNIEGSYVSMGPPTPGTTPKGTLSKTRGIDISSISSLSQGIIIIITIVIVILIITMIIIIVIIKVNLVLIGL